MSAAAASLAAPQLLLTSNYPIHNKATQCPEKHPGHFWSYLKEELPDFSNFW